jgi:hypothetical protein
MFVFNLLVYSNIELIDQIVGYIVAWSMLVGSHNTLYPN